MANEGRDLGKGKEEEEGKGGERGGREGKGLGKAAHP